MDVMQKSAVTIRVHGKDHRFDMPKNATNILEAATDAGIDLPSSCRAGSCATCRAKVIEGRVVMAANMVLDDDDLAAGFVLACQSTPLTPSVVLDFDTE